MHRLKRGQRWTSAAAGKLRRLALIAAGAAALGACNDKPGCCYDVVCAPPPLPSGIIVSPQQVTVAIGDTARFVALVSGSFADPCSDDPKPTSRAATWSLSNGSAASIVGTPDSNTVIVRGIAAGSVSVIAAAVAEPTAKAAGLLIVQ